MEPAALWMVQAGAAQRARVLRAGGDVCCAQALQHAHASAAAVTGWLGAVSERCLVLRVLQAAGCICSPMGAAACVRVLQHVDGSQHYHKM